MAIAPIQFSGSLSGNTLRIMKIIDFKVWKEDLELTNPYTIAFKTVEKVENIFVQILLDNGVWGLGAGAPAPMITGEELLESIDALKGVSEDLIGHDIRSIYGLIQNLNRKLSRFPAALTAIDVALHDAFTKWLGVPLAQFLGQVHKTLPTSITIGIQSLEDTILEAKDRVQQGFKILKLKTGRRVEEDVEIFTKLRETVGKNIKIRVDANQGYKQDSFIRFYDKTRHLEIEFFEQPFPAKELMWMQFLPPEIKQKCAADESLHAPSDAVRIIANQAFGIYNIKLMKCGGLVNGRRIAQIAHDFGIEVMWGCMDESRISIAAALHLAFASPATKYLDLDGSIDLARDLVDGGFKIVNGEMQLMDQAGLGVQLI